MTLLRAAAAAARAIGATAEEANALAVAAVRPAFAGSPLWFALPPNLAPDADAPVGELIAWCAEVRDGEALGAAVGLVHEVYAAHGWAIAAAQAAAGERVVPDVADAVAARARARFVIETASAVAAADPDLAALAAVAVEPAGGDLVRGALAALIDTVAAEPPIGARPSARAEATLDEVAALFEVALPPAAAGRDDASLADLWGAVHDLGRHPWMWDAVAEWLDGDPLIFAKAIARGRGRADVVELIERMRHELVARLAAAVEATWRAEVERTRRVAVLAESTPLADAIYALASTAAEGAAVRLATAARARWERRAGEELATVCAELLGDPRDLSALWEAHVPAIRAALEAT
ncbi:MAG: hypothetical protein ABJE66_15165 [Deltaproteobacteria bacterium]